MRPIFAVLACVATASSAMISGCGDRPNETSALPVGAATPGAGGDSSTVRRNLTLSAEVIEHGAIRWVPVASRDFAGVIEVPGQLVANEDHTLRLGAPAMGRVVTVPVQVGDRVEINQSLVTLQSAEAGAARADNNKALADLNARRAAAAYARAARDRAERLLVVKAISRQELERAVADEELAKADVARAEAEAARAVALLGQLGVESDGRMVVRASIAGVVLNRDAIPGAVVQAGMPLVTVSDLSTLWLDIAVADRSSSALRRGARVRFIVSMFPSDTFSARVIGVGGALDPATRTLPVRALVENFRGALRAQTFVTVWFEGGERLKSVAVPESAVMLLNGKPVVFVAHPDPNGGARVERREVAIGGTVGGLVQVLSGVLPGDLVVTSGAFAVKAEFSRSKMAGS
jgi:cobalt-zinc-cadmium efflux system membrane fusion protein